MMPSPGNREGLKGRTQPLSAESHGNQTRAGLLTDGSVAAPAFPTFRPVARGSNGSPITVTRSWGIRTPFPLHPFRGTRIAVRANVAAPTRLRQGPSERWRGASRSFHGARDERGLNSVR